MWPGRRKSDGCVPSRTVASAVCERSSAEMPVVVVAASIDTVKAVWWLSVFVVTIWGRSSFVHQSADIGMQIRPLAWVAMKLTLWVVANSAAQMQSPSFSRSSSSVTTMISPRRRAARQSSTESNVGESGVT